MSPAFTPETLGNYWGVSAATVRNLVRDGALRAFKVGRQIRIRPEAVEEYECQSGESACGAENTPPSGRSMGKQSGSRSAPPIFLKQSGG